MVEAEEVGEFLGVLGAAFHGVQQRQLTVQQDLAAAGEVDEDVGDAAPHVGLLDGGLDGGPLQGVEGLADLAQLVGAVVEAGRLGLDVDLLAGGEAAHHAGQAHAGHLVRLLAQPAQVPDEAAADAEGDDERADERGEAQDAGDGGLDDDAGGDGPDPVAEAVDGLPAHPAEVLEDGPGDGLPAVGVEDADGPAGAGEDHGVLGGEQRPGVGAAPVVLVGLLVGEGEDGEVGGVERLALGDVVGEGAQVLAAHAAGGERGGEQGVLAGDGLAGATEADHGAGLPVHLGVLEGAEAAEEVVVGLDDVVVRLEGGPAGEGAVLGLAAQAVQAVEALLEGAETLRRGVAHVVAHASLDARAEGDDRLVGGGAQRAQVGAHVGAARVGELDERLAALPLQGAHHVAGRVADLAHDVDRRHQLRRLAAGDDGGEDPQPGQGHQGHQQQCHDLPADRLPAKAHGLPYGNPGGRGWCSDSNAA